MWNISLALLGTLAAVVGVSALQGLSPLQLLHFGSLFVVVLGVWVATGIAHSPGALFRSLRILSKLRSHETDLQELAQEIVTSSERIRKEGLLSLDAWADSVEHPVWAQVMERLKEGVELPVQEQLLGRLKEERERELMQSASVFASAGQFAPGAGIIGAVLGLMQVLQSLEDPSKLGPGLVSAFSSILYGLIFSMWVFLPFSRRLESALPQVAQDIEVCELGIRSISRGESPQTLKDILSVWTEN